MWHDGGVKEKDSDLSVARRRRTPNEIAEIFEEYRRSGLSLQGFARERQLCYASLLRWRARQRSGRGLVRTEERLAHPNFVPVEIQAETGRADYVVNWPDGRSLQIPSGFESTTLRRLLEALEACR